MGHLGALMRRSSRLVVTALTIYTSASLAASAAEVSADRTAKFLAGIAVPAAPADSIAESPWALHSRELDRAWKRTEEQQLPAIASWAPAFLGSSHSEPGTMFYMFSGPDFLYAHAFFADARTYILCGTEPVGSIPDLTSISPEALPGALANLRKSLNSVLSWSFFITKDMKSDLIRTQLSGTLPLLYVFVARTGYTINAVELVALDRNGNITPNGKGETPGVRISMSREPGLDQSGRRLAVESFDSQTLYYFCTDLSDEGIKSKPGFLRFCQGQGRGVSLLKAASYLMHEPGFGRVRDFLLQNSEIILQDDSGIPLRFFSDDTWSIRYCGRYAGPINIFTKYFQDDLANAYSRVVPVPLPFSFGYQWQPNRSDLMIAARVDAQPSPVSNDEPPYSGSRTDEYLGKIEARGLE